MRRTATLVIGIILGFGLGILILFIVYHWRPSPRISQVTRETQPLQKLEIGVLAPDFELVSISGEQIRLQDLRGRFVLLNFWATWCDPCRQEMPIFQSRADEFPEDLIILAVNAQDTPEDIRAFMSELELTFDNLMDSEGKVHQAYWVHGFPTSFFIDADGFLRIVHIGVMTEDQLDSYLTELGFNG